jgi:glycosyltransferase involved in cell wall biosynthesis
MKIALVFPTFYPTIGGIETYIHKLAEEFVKLGHEVAVFTSDNYYSDRLPSDHFREKDPSKNSSVIYLPSKKFLGYVVPRKESLKQITAWGPDIIHLNLPHPYCTVLALQMRKSGIPLIATYHGHVNPKSIFKLLAARLEVQLYRFFYKQIIVTTEFYKNKLAPFFPKKKILVIPPGVDNIFSGNRLSRAEARKELHFPHGQSNQSVQKAVLFVGAMDDSHLYKGISVLLKCAALTPGIKYILIGGGAKKPDYLKMADKLNLKNCEFIEPVQHEKLPLYYKAADVFVLPSINSSEGFGLVLLEAMCCGTPVITTNRTGSSSLIAQAEAGLVAKAGSTQSLKQCIEKILNNTILGAKLVKNGHRLTQSMTWHMAAQKTIHVYEQSLPKN